MRKIISILLAIVMCSSLCACSESNEITLEEKCIGTWTIQNGGNFIVNEMELYKGGTGKGFGKDDTNDSYYSLTWEIEDNVINISLDNSEMFVYGYVIEDDVMTSVDGTIVYNKKE